MALSTESDINYNHKCYDYIPVACHYDDDTLLTKNGDMIQIMQIRGSSAEKLGDELSNLREIIRGSIKEHLKSEDFAFWIHTVRRKTDLNDYSEFSNNLSRDIHGMWKKKNYWHDKYINTLYVSVVHLRPKTEQKLTKAVKKYLSLKKTEKYFEESFKTMANRLHQVTDNLIDYLERFGAKKLTIKEEDGFLFSEPMFLYKRIIQLSEYDAPLPVVDIADSLSSQHYAVGNNQIEVIDEDGNKKFSAILSIKEYHDMPEASLDTFLRVAVEFIATEVFYFTDKKSAARDFEEVDKIYKISKSDRLRSNTIAPIMDSDPESKTSCCMQQISMMLLNDNIDGLVSDITKTSKILASLGIVHVQEDINLENTYWAQLPGNFSYLRRASPNTVDSIAAFASLHNFPMGNAKNPWGKAVTLLRTENGTPYFFNFHDSDGNGNTIIYGPKNSGHTVMLNFFLSESMKYNPTVLYLTKRQKSRILIDGLEGKWLQDNITDKIAPNSFNAIEITEKHDPKDILKALENFSSIPSDVRKILVIDDLTDIIQDKVFDQVTEIIKQLNNNNGILFSNINLHKYKKVYSEQKYQDLKQIIACKIILTDDEKDIDNIELLGISENENNILKSINAISRLFLIKHDKKSSLLELSLGGRQEYMKILSVNERELAIYEDLKKKHNNLDDLIQAMFQQLANSASK